MEYKKSLFIFRRDLRLEDNTGLIAAAQSSKKVIPCFIFDPRQIGKANAYRSMNAIQFMIESLQDLEQQLKRKKGKLYLFTGKTEDIVKKLISKENVDAVFVNRDYTPFSIKRDTAIKKLCAKNNISFKSFGDLLINEPEDIKTQGGIPYSIFTPFYKKAKKIPVKKSQKLSKFSFLTKKIGLAEQSNIYKKIVKKENKHLHVNGGRSIAKKILRNIKKFKNYGKERDFPSIHTTHLSAHLKFGTISIRETYDSIEKKLGKTHPLLRQLYWRDFWTHVAFHAPFVFGQPYHQKYKHLRWSKSKKMFDTWCKGKTGFPIIDAGMRQLNQTGFMHNRVRMIVASFLIKDLHINWLWGEKYFAQKLVDYDPALNNGNWQWSASTGCDAQPYFRIFNPWLQQKKFDKNCKYIKKWIPELENIDPKIIHNWFKKEDIKIKNYPKPIVDHKVESKKAKALYNRVQ